MRSLFRLATATSLFAAATACGGDDGDGDDTTAPVTSASPGAGEIRGRVTLTANETATVFYTTDGSEPTDASPQFATSGTMDLRGEAVVTFYAVDAAGNREATQRLSYSAHAFGPRPVEVVTARTTGSDITVTWTAPAGAANVAIVRHQRELGATPADGAPLVVGGAVGSGTVVYVGPATMFVDTSPGVGGYVYTAFAAQANGVWSEGRSAGAAIRVAADGMLNFTVGAQPSVTIAQPANFSLGVSNIQYDTDEQTLEFDLTVTSSLPSLAFAPKVVFPGATNTLTATRGTRELPLLTMAPFTDYPGAKAFGLGATPFATGTSHSLRVSVTGVLSGAFTLPASIITGRTIYGGRWCGDGNAVEATDPSVNLSDRGFTELPAYTDRHSCTAAMGTALSPAGYTLYSGARHWGRVTSFDVTTGMETQVLNLAMTSAAGSVTDVILDPSGLRLWALLNDGMHAASNRSTAAAYEGRQRPPADNVVYLVEIDPATLVERGRVELGRGDARLRGRRLALSRDGRKIAAPLGWPYDETGVASSARVAIVDAATRTLIDADPSTAAIDLIAAPSSLRPAECAFSWNGSRLACGNSWHNSGGVDTETIGLIDLTVPSLVMQAFDPLPETTGRGRAITFLARPDGSMAFVGDTRGFITIAADNSVAVQGTDRITGQAAFVFAEAPDRIIYYSYGALSVVDPAMGTMTFLSNGDAYAHHPAPSPY